MNHFPFIIFMSRIKANGIKKRDELPFSEKEINVIINLKKGGFKNCCSELNILKHLKIINLHYKLFTIDCLK